jgi:hypothetical protein
METFVLGRIWEIRQQTPPGAMTSAIEPLVLFWWPWRRLIGNVVSCSANHDRIGIHVPLID